MKGLSLALLILSAILLLAGPTHASASKRPVLLMYHGGGFFFDQGDPMAQAAAAAKTRGFRPKVIDYPMDNAPAVFAQASALAARLDRKGRTVYAYGESAGGAVAIRLAVLGLARAVSAQAPITDIQVMADQVAQTGTLGSADNFLRAIGLDTASARALSAVGHSTRSPLMVEAPVNDGFSTPTLPWAAQQPLVKGVSVPGTHLDPAYYAENLDLAMDYLKDHAGG